MVNDALFESLQAVKDESSFLRLLNICNLEIRKLACSLKQPL